jgi:hypothetical protein
MDIAYLLYVTGVFAVILGGLHFFFPMLFDYDGAIPLDDPSLRPLKPFKLGAIRYNTRRRDVRGIAWVMNHFVSYNLVAYGVIDLLWQAWLPTQFGAIVCLWMAGGWFVRAAAQLYLGRRVGDWLILCGFALVGVAHVAVAVALVA